MRHNALNAAFRDPRFPALDPEELPEIRFEVSILSAPKPIAGPEEFQIGEHGIILQKNGRSAVFLPQVAPEQGWDRVTTLNYLAMKAGLVANAWQMPDARFFVFTATDTTFTVLSASATGEASTCIPKVYKVYGYKVG